MEAQRMTTHFSSETMKGILEMSKDKRKVSLYEINQFRQTKAENTSCFFLH